MLSSEKTTINVIDTTELICSPMFIGLDVGRLHMNIFSNEVSEHNGKLAIVKVIAMVFH